MIARQFCESDLSSRPMGLAERSDKDDDQLTICTGSSSTASSSRINSHSNASPAIASNKDFADIVEARCSTAAPTG